MFAWRFSGCVLLLVCLGACDSSARERSEARRFLASYGALDHRDAMDEREREVTDLAALPLHSPIVMKARDACVSAHRALLEAERAQERAAGALEKALASRPDGEALSKQQAAQVQQSITAAETALSGARTRFAPCETDARDLALRYAER